MAISTITNLASINEVQFEESVLSFSAHVNCIFEIGYKHFQTVALIDTGNNFGTCVSEVFAHNLGYTPELLQPSPTDMVKQAGEGTMLQVTGLLPSNVLSNSFRMENCRSNFQSTRFS